MSDTINVSIPDVGEIEVSIVTGPTIEISASNIPGPQGAAGANGQDGTNGTDGTDAYVYIRYSATEPTQDSDMKTTPDAWMGIYSGDASTAPTAYTAYTWYKIKGETGASGGVSDVQVNGTSVVTSGVANVPAAVSNGAYGVVKIGVDSLGLKFDNDGRLQLAPATDYQIQNPTESTIRPIAPKNQKKAVFYAFAQAAGDSTQSSSSNAVGTYTEDAKSKISEMLNGYVSVTGSTPSITAKSGIRYVCGEISTLALTLPASGIVDIVFESGSTPTVLTITPPTGVTEVLWSDGWDEVCEANTVYELNVMDGKYGVKGAWT